MQASICEGWREGPTPPAWALLHSTLQSGGCRGAAVLCPQLLPPRETFSMTPGKRDLGQCLGGSSFVRGQGLLTPPGVWMQWVG